MGARILVVHDDEPLRVVLEQSLRKEGYTVDGLSRVDEAETSINRSAPDVLVINWVMPGISGIDLCRRMRSRPYTLKLPIVLLTDVPADRIAGLSAGADDCLLKPFSTMELVIRVKNLLRRTNPALLDYMIKVGDLTLDRAAHRVHRQKREVKLGPTEFKLLEFLMSSPGKVYSRSELRASLWGDDATVDERAVDVHIGRLRKGIGFGKADNVIRTVRGAGYALSDY
jgi:two-component system, OmpR family, phosphate regulon response regulator PhoB